MLIGADKFRKARRLRAIAAWHGTALDYTETKHMIKFMQAIADEPLPPGAVVMEIQPPKPFIIPAMNAGNENTPARV